MAARWENLGGGPHARELRHLAALLETRPLPLLELEFVRLLSASRREEAALQALRRLIDAYGKQPELLLLRGPHALTETLDTMSTWLEEHEYQSLAQMQGSMSLARCPDPSAYERAQYLRVLRTGW